jgi:hypothetical protein
MVELWGAGIVECCNIGKLEWWKNSGRNVLTMWIRSSFHYSITPVLHS